MWYDLEYDRVLIEQSIAKQYRVLPSEQGDLRYSDWIKMVSGLMDDTPLGRIVMIRSETDKERIKNFSPEQRRIQSDWKRFRSQRLQHFDSNDYDKQMLALESMFASLAGGEKKMSTEVGSIYLSLNLKDNVQAQIGHLASKADRQAASSFKRVGDTAGKAISRAMANIKLPTQPLNRSVESAKAKIEQLRVAMGALERKDGRHLQRENTTNYQFYKDANALDQAAAKATLADKAYQKLGAQYDKLILKRKQAEISLASAIKVADSQTEAKRLAMHERVTQAAQKAAEKQKAAAEKAAQHQQSAVSRASSHIQSTFNRLSQSIRMAIKAAFITSVLPCPFHIAFLHSVCFPALCRLPFHDKPHQQK